MAEKKEYIERSEVIRTILGQPPEHYPELYYRDIKELPAADVLEVVRCKDCEHYFCDTPYCKKHKVGYCAFDEIVKDKNHFCSYGERKELTP